MPPDYRDVAGHVSQRINSVRAEPPPRSRRAESQRKWKGESKAQTARDKDQEKKDEEQQKNEGFNDWGYHQQNAYGGYSSQ